MWIRVLVRFGIVTSLYQIWTATRLIGAKPEDPWAVGLVVVSLFLLAIYWTLLGRIDGFKSKTRRRRELLVESHGEGKQSKEEALKECEQVLRG